MITEDERNLWERYGQQDITGQKQLILFYLPLVDIQARHIARSTGANWEDLRQDGTIGLMQAIARFDPSQGVPFKAFARSYIRGAIFDSPELTRDVTRRQDEIYRKVRQTEEEMTRTLQRHPTIEEVAENAGLTAEQIRKALDARGVAFAAAMPDAEVPQASGIAEPPGLERKIFLLEALAHLHPREQQIIQFYYWEDQPHEEIARRLGLSVSNVTKIRQRAIGKLRELLDVKRKGGQDDDGRSGK